MQFSVVVSQRSTSSLVRSEHQGHRPHHTVFCTRCTAHDKISIFLCKRSRFVENLPSPSFQRHKAIDEIKDTAMSAGRVSKCSARS